MSASLVGFWRLSSCTMESEEGVVHHPLGERAVGSLVYAATGHMMVCIQAADRPTFASDDLRGGTEAEWARAARTCLAYSGTWSMRDDTVAHDVVVSLFPNWCGTQQQRRVELAGDRLVLSAQTETGGGHSTARMTWERVRVA